MVWPIFKVIVYIYNSLILSLSHNLVASLHQAVAVFISLYFMIWKGKVNFGFLRMYLHCKSLKQIWLNYDLLSMNTRHIHIFYHLGWQQVKTGKSTKDRSWCFSIIEENMDLSRKADFDLFLAEYLFNCRYWANTASCQTKIDTFKVHIFLEGYGNWRNLHSQFDVYFKVS